MPNIQSVFGKINVFEDFQGQTSSATLSSATNTRFNDLSIAAIHDTTFINSTTRVNGVATFVINNAASDGVSIFTSPMQPSVNAPMVVEARFANSSATDFRAFIGFQQTVSLTATVLPYTVSATTLTANAAGNVAGFYVDTGATTKDFRFLAGINSAASTTAAIAYDFNHAATTLGALGIRSQITLTASSMYTCRVVMYPDGSVEGYAGHTTQPSADLGLSLICRLKAGVITTTNLFFPILSLRSGSTGTPTATCDYFGATGQRDWTAT